MRVSGMKGTVSAKSLKDDLPWAAIPCGSMFKIPVRISLPRTTPTSSGTPKRKPIHRLTPLMCKLPGEQDLGMK